LSQHARQAWFAGQIGTRSCDLSPYASATLADERIERLPGGMVFSALLGWRRMTGVSVLEMLPGGLVFSALWAGTG
jgi:hypothetical protein